MEKTTPYLQKQITVMRKPISAAEYLAATLRFLATGESYSSLEFQFRISKSTLSNMIPYVCNVIYTVLKDDYLACPQSELEWLNIAKEFQDRWQFPNCLGAGDGKHIRLLCPSNSGSEYYNYKGYYSLVLMAFVGPEYQFLFVDVGCQGSISDGGVFRKTSLWKALEENSIYLPQAKPLPQNPDPVFEDTSDIDIDYFFVCDDAFPLGLHLMKPYSKRQLSEERRIFNYRLSRARRVSENAFGILAARFGVLHTMMRLGPDKATKVVLACCALHNMLLCKSSCSYCPPGSMDYENENGDVITGSWRESASSNSSNFRSMPKCKERSPKNAEDMRDIICYYVNGPDAIPWQWKSLVV